VDTLVVWERGRRGFKEVMDVLISLQELGILTNVVFIVCDFRTVGQEKKSFLSNDAHRRKV
jgi:hypothetical protein